MVFAQIRKNEMHKIPRGFKILSQETIDRWFVSLFNGISTFVGYLMPKPFPLKNSSGTI